MSGWFDLLLADLLRGPDWLLAKQVFGLGDWQKKSAAEPGGWAFEYRNDFYPDKFTQKGTRK